MPALPRHNLPGARTRFVGRQGALADVERLLGATRLLKLTGIGGCGQTRLALHFAEQRLAAYPDGVWFVDLAPLREPGRVASACAAAPGLADDAAQFPALLGLAAMVMDRGRGDAGLPDAREVLQIAERRAAIE